MLVQIIQGTPGWVWGLFAALLLLGLAQTRTRELSLGRVTILPVALIALSLVGTASAFGLRPLSLAAWLAGFGIVWRSFDHAATLRGARWDAATERLTVPGSWLPLGLILGIFLLRYVVGVSLALHPQLRADDVFAAGCSLAYGAFSGAFWSRARVLRNLAAGGGRSVAA